MADLITQVQDRFDKIVIDTPPVLPVTDAAVASAYAEAVVVVVRHGRTSRAQVANAAATLENVDARVVGSVLNMKRSSRAERRRYGHHGYYFGQSGYGPPRYSEPRRRPRSGSSSPAQAVNGRATVQASPVGDIRGHRRRARRQAG